MKNISINICKKHTKNRSICVQRVSDEHDNGRNFFFHIVTYIGEAPLHRGPCTTYGSKKKMQSKYSMYIEEWVKYEYF